MAASSGQYVALAKQLPPRLTRFLARYPPSSILGAATTDNSASSRATALNTSSSDPNATNEETEISTETSSIIPSFPNPFLPQRHPVTGKLHDPQFSLRRQAELVKLARDHGVEELLPFTVKKTEERGRAREENGLRVKGTGIGERVKGKRWERTLKGRLEKRRQAMLGMPRLVEEWKQVSLLFFSKLRSLHANVRCREAMDEVGRSGRDRRRLVYYHCLCVYTISFLLFRRIDSMK